MDDQYERQERLFIEGRYNVSDEELLARVRSAPDMGGRLLVELSEFMMWRNDGMRPDDDALTKPWEKVRR